MERVSIIEGKIPVLIVAPHGYEEDDENTDLIAEQIASEIDCYAVINRGWERADQVDFLNDKADCNNIYHCHEDVVREEFLNPILKYKTRILKNYDQMLMFMIHGMANRHRKISGDMKLDVVVGYGAGSPNSYTCELWQKDFFVDALNKMNITTYEGGAGSMMSGWSRQNMNQLFRKSSFKDSRVRSLQLEIIYELREDTDVSLLTAEYLSQAMMGLVNARGCREIKSKVYF